MPAKLGALATVEPFTGPSSDPHQLKRRSNIFVVGTELLVMAEMLIPFVLEDKSLLLTKI